MYGYAIGERRFHENVLAALATMETVHLVYAETAVKCGDFYIGDYTIVDTVDTSEVTGTLTFTDYGVVRTVEYKNGKKHNEQLWYRGKQVVRIETYYKDIKDGLFSWIDGVNKYEMVYNMGMLRAYLRVGDGVTKKIYANGKMIAGSVTRRLKN